MLDSFKSSRLKPKPKFNPTLVSNTESKFPNIGGSVDSSLVTRRTGVISSLFVGVCGCGLETVEMDDAADGVLELECCVGVARSDSLYGIVAVGIGEAGAVDAVFEEENENSFIMEKLRRRLVDLELMVVGVGEAALSLVSSSCPRVYTEVRRDRGTDPK